MQSPKFSKKAAYLRRLVASKRLTEIWKSQIRDKMRKQIVPDAVEFLDFHVDIRKRTADLEALICGGNYLPSPILRLTMEKSRGLCRQIALPDPADAIVLQALSNALWRDIAPKAPCDTAFFAPQDQPFSKKNVFEEEDEWGYGPIESWLDFQKEILKFSITRKYVVVTDIANYYDFVIHQYLRSILSEYGLEKESALDLLLFILDATLWRPDYMPNFGIGLPQMDLDAPRLLAHTHLFEIDSIFSSDSAVDYARYMDDIDFGVDSVAKAKAVLRDLDLALQTRNLRVNSGKTKILTSQEAVEHFKVKENVLIDKLRSKVENYRHLSKRAKIFGQVSIRILRSKRARRIFDHGNGDKLIKRLLGVVRITGVALPSDIFRWILYKKPGLRKDLFYTWSLCGISPSQIKRLAGFLLSGEAIDDMSYILSSNALVQSHFRRSMPNQLFSRLRYAFSDSRPSLLYANMHLVSRFDSYSLLWVEIKSTVSVWSRSKFNCRQVAGFSPLFFGTPHWDEFCNLVRRWGGDEGISVFDFHTRLREKPSAVKAVKAFIDAPNPSSGTAITHAKALMLLSVVQNDSLSKLYRAQMVGKHSTMMSDAHYQPVFSRALSNMK